MAIKLKLELIGSNKEEYGDTTGFTIWGQTEEDWKTLEKYGHCKQSISREVLMDEESDLRDLHFVIQKAFGWQDYHLHEFSLGEDDGYDFDYEDYDDEDLPDDEDDDCRRRP